MLSVRFERCNQCLLSPERIVSSDRAVEILNECRRKDCHFVCHKSSMAGVTEVCCRAFYDLPEGTNLIRIMERLGGILFTDDEGQPVGPQPFQRGGDPV